MTGLQSLPRGMIGAVVTYLEMTRRPEPIAVPASSLTLERWPEKNAGAYRDLFRKVGARWLWFSRLQMDDETLVAAMGEVHSVLDQDGQAVGLLELDFRMAGDCLIRFLGLVPELSGRGHGHWLFANTLRLAWREDVERLRVNTCSLDHPAALPSYLKAGFVPYGRAFESFPDPRLAGLLPMDCAPQIPVLR